VLFTNRKSHTSFRLVPKSVTLNDPEQRKGHLRVISLKARVANATRTISA